MFANVLDNSVFRLGLNNLETGKDDGGVEDFFPADFSLQEMFCVRGSGWGAWQSAISIVLLVFSLITSISLE